MQEMALQKPQLQTNVPFFSGKVHGVGQRVDAEIRNVMMRLEEPKKKHIKTHTHIKKMNETPAT